MAELALDGDELSLRLDALIPVVEHTSTAGLPSSWTNELRRVRITETLRVRAQAVPTERGSVECTGPVQLRSMVERQR